MDTIELKGLIFRVEIKHDDSLGCPWDEHDGHGPVRNISADDPKAPGERVMYKARHRQWLYDHAEAMRIAKRDVWGMSDEDRAAFKKNTGREPTPGEIALAAVQRDFDHLRGFASGEWGWCGVVVTLLDVDGNATDETESLWGIESNSYDYHKEVARELAGDIARRVGRKKYITKRIKVRT